MEDKKHFTTVDEYISTFPDDTQVILRRVQKAIRSVLPEAEEAISYNIPVFKLNDAYVVYFAGWAGHISLYPVPKGDEAFQEEIKPYIGGRGTLKFMLNAPIPYDLIKKVVATHLEEKLKSN